MELTPEQRAIVESDARTLAINAFAGTGKTSSLVEYAKARPDKRILYLAFNRSIAEEARERMPGNVEVRTSHSLAFRAIAKNWPKGKLSGKMTAWSLLQHFESLPIFASCKNHTQKIDRANLLQSIIVQFTFSDKTDIEKFAQRFASENTLSPLKMTKMELIEAVKVMWEKIIDPRSDVPATHDVYFKLWQMSRPKIRADIILLDEAQDTNPALFNVFMAQNHTIRVLVGDRHQNIYHFRGAINAMEKMPDCETKAITYSFRFGENIAEVANHILREFKGETLKLKGANKDAGVITTEPVSPYEMRTAFLFRTNAGLFDVAAQLCQDGDIGLLGKFEDYSFADILDTYHLYAGRKDLIENPYIRSFDSFDEMKEYAERIDEKELTARVRVVEKYKHDIPDLHDQIKSRIHPESDLILTTAHRSKGCQWPQVIIAEDFPATCNDDGIPLSRVQENEQKEQNQKEQEKREEEQKQNQMDQFEANLLYVAVTRAEKRLVLSEDLNKFVEYFNNKENDKLLHPTETTIHDSNKTCAEAY